MKAWGILGMAALATLAQAQGVMTTQGSFAVSDSGAATYTLPIQVPPGTGGMEPKLALTYNSQAGNGLLGVGWSISGLSAITRCPRTMAQDGVRGGVNLDSNDRYCLDGERLIAISGSNGGNGTEYRTERESFAKIVSYGSAGNGPAWFKVWTKAGLIMEYGNTPNSAIEAQGKASIAVWAVNKVSDVKGNYYTVTYTEDNANGAWYPARIDYTGNSNTGLAPNSSVVFLYDQRSDVISGYRAGSKTSIPVRLYRVKVVWSGAEVKGFDLSYVSSPATLRSTLSSILECTGSFCNPPLTFSWSNQNSAGAGWKSMPSYGPPAVIVNNVEGKGAKDYGVEFIDVNGGGVVAIVQNVWWSSTDTQKGFWYNNGYGWQSGTSSYIPPAAIVSNTAGNGAQDNGVRFIDLNGDGVADMVQHVWRDGRSIQKGAWLNNVGNGWQSAPQYEPPVAIVDNGSGRGIEEDNGVRFVDLNGDGLVDMVQHIRWNSNDIRKGAWLNTGNGWKSAPSYVPPAVIVSNTDGKGAQDNGVRFIDLNGDGLVDMVQHVWLNGKSIEKGNL